MAFDWEKVRTHTRQGNPFTAVPQPKTPTTKAPADEPSSSLLNTLGYKDKPGEKMSPIDSLKYGTEKTLSGFAAPIEGLGRLGGSVFYNAVSGVADIVGADKLADQYEEVAKGFAEKNYTSDWQKSIDERYNPTAVNQLVGDTIGAVSGMLLPIGGGAAIQGAKAGATGAKAIASMAKPATGNLGLGIIGGGAAGNAMTSGYEKSQDLNTSQLYGVASGTAEVVSERIFGFIPFLGNGIADNAIKKTIGKLTTKPAVKSVLSGVIGSAGEGLEEILVGVADPFLQRITVDPDAPLATKEELAQQFTIGVLASVVLRGAFSGGINKDRKEYNSRIQSAGDALNDLAEGIHTSYRPEPLQVTSKTTPEDLKAYSDKLVAASQTQVDEVMLRGMESIPVRDEEIDINPDLEEAKEEYKNALFALESHYGTADLTPEQKADAINTFGIDLDEIGGKVTTAAQESFLPPRARLEKAIANGTAAKNYSPQVIQRFLAQKVKEDEKTNPTVFIENKPMTKSEFKAEVLKKRPKMTDAQFEELFAKAQFENIRNEETEEFIKTANQKFSKYGVKVDYSYTLSDRENGFYDPETKTITLNAKTIKSRGVASYVLSHEITHYAATKDPTMLIDLKASMAMLGYDINVMNSERRELYEKQTGKTVDDEYLTEESIADFVSIIMRDDSVLTQLAQRKPSLLEKIKNFITEQLTYDKHDRLTRKYKREAVKRIQAALEGKPLPKQKQDGPRLKDVRHSLDDKGHGLYDFAEVRYSISPPYADSSKSYKAFVETLPQDALAFNQMFSGVFEAGKTGKDNLVTKFVRVSTWNEMAKDNPEAVKNILENIPEDIQAEMRISPDGYIAPTPLEEEFKMNKSFMQRLVDALPYEAASTMMDIDGKQIQVASGDRMQVIGGESYRRALTAEVRKMYKAGQIKPVGIGTLSSDKWGAMGFLASNGKTGASGDFTTLCPQMMFNRGCFYCYRRAALETGLNNKLVGQNIWYSGEILRMKDSDVESLNKNGGLRLQSFGDWMPHFTSMLADVMYDAELRGLQIKVITKEPSMIEVVAHLKEQGLGKNLYFNISADYVIEKAGIPAKGVDDMAPLNPERPFMRDKDSQAWWKRAVTVQEASKFREKYAWVNTRIVATTQEEFIRGLKSPIVDVVTGYHGAIREFERVSSETGEKLVGIEALGDSGMPRFIFKDGAYEIDPEYPGKTKTHKKLAQKILDEGLVETYYQKSCCITGRCNSCKGYCGVDSKKNSFEIKNATNRDEESKAFWEDNMRTADVNALKFSLEEDFNKIAYSDRGDFRFSLVRERETLDFLEKQKPVRVFRAMQMIDGKLYPPMAAKVSDGGKRNLVSPSELGSWEQAAERSDLIKNGKFTLDKANGSSLMAAYNPYYHTSLSPLNDQFTSAYNRPNLVVVEGVVPESELTSGYRAPYAKDAVGEMSWHSGPVSSKLPSGKKRRVILSRWFKPLRVVPDSEVAQHVATLLDGENIPIPQNVVTPSLLAELEKVGVQIGGQRGLKDIRYSLEEDYPINYSEYKWVWELPPSVRKKYLSGVKAWMRREEWEDELISEAIENIENSQLIDVVGEGGPSEGTIKKWLAEFHQTNGAFNKKIKSMSPGQQDYFKDSVVKEQVYHGTSSDFFVFDKDRAGANNGRLSELGFFFTDREIEARSYGSNVKEVFINLTNPLIITKEDFKTHDLANHQHNYLATYIEKNKDGHDGVIIKNVKMGNFISNVFIVFNSNQIKSVDNLNPTTDPDIRYSLQQDTDGKTTASYTDDKIQELFDVYSVKADSKNLDYAQRYVAYISPDDFLSLTVTDGNIGKMKASVPKDYGKLDIDKMKGDTSGPVIIFDTETGEVVGHEGRHRMILLQNEGVENVAVMVHPYPNERGKYEREKLLNLKLSGEEFSTGKASGKVVLDEVIPLSNRYRQEVYEKFGDNTGTDIRYSLEQIPANLIEFESDEVRKGVESSQGRVDAFKEILKTGEDHFMFAAKDILEPIYVVAKDGKYIAYDGNHRLMAYKQMDENGLVPARVYDSYEDYRADKKYSLQDTDGNPLTKEQMEYFSESQARDENGNLVKVYHGTMSDFWEFSREYGNKEGDMGAGFYFTNNDTDVWENYANENGADLTTKIETRAEQLLWDDDMELEEAMEIARQEFMNRTEPRLIEAYLNIKNPIILDGRSSTTFDYNEVYDEEADEYGEPSGEFVEFVESLKNAVEDYDTGGYYTDQLNKMYQRFSDDGSISAWDAIKDAKDLLSDFEDYDSAVLGGHEVVRQALEDMGYDGIIDKMVAWKFGSKSGRRNPMQGVTPDTTHYIVFSSNQAKEVTNEKPTDSPDIRYSLSRSLDDLLADWENTQQTYGTKAPGMEPRVAGRENQVPEQIDDETRVSDFMRSAYEAPSTPDAFIDPMKLAILSGTGSYIVLDDKTAQTTANGILARKGINGATEQWRGLTRSNRALSKSDLVLGEQLLVNAADRGDLVEWERLVSELAAEATRAGQNLQAFSMLKKLSPQGRAYNVQHFVEKLQDDLAERGRSIQIDIDPELLNRLLGATTVDEMDRVEEDIIKDIAEQVPPTVTNRVVAWRYLAMLGNGRTHLRNMTSNFTMWIVRGMKDKTAATMEGVAANTFAKDMKRTKTLKWASKDVKAFAKQDWQVMRPSLLQGGVLGFDDMFDKYRKNFGNSPLGKIMNKADKGNSGALNAEDSLFMGLAYRSALSHYMTANNLTPEFLSQGTKEANKKLAAARDYSSREALKATYREANTLATALNSLENKNVATKLIVGGLMPFKKTPLNIIKRGVEYSPAGLLEAITVETVKLLDSNVKSARAKANGKDYIPSITAAHYIDRLASGLTGSAAFGIGMFLSAMGVIQAGGDDDKEGQYEQMLGEQHYSINILGRSYTLDWLTPISMPLMAGVEFAKAIYESDEEFDFNRFLEALLTTADPMTELSMLQGVNQALNSFEDNKLGAAVQSAAESYAGQFIPTLFGQAARTSDDTRRTNYAPADTDFPGGKRAEQFKNKIVNKADIFNLAEKEPYINMWGQEEVRPDNLLVRGFEQFVAPYYSKEITSTAVDDELARVFAVNENTGVLPGTPKSYLTVNGERYDMSPSDYTEFKRKTGQEAYTALDKVFKSAEYRQMSQSTKEKVIVDVFTYARENAKADYSEKKNLPINISSVVDKVDSARSTGIDVGTYFVAMQSISETFGDVDPKTGETVRKDTSGLTTRKTKVLDYLGKLNLTQAQKDEIMRANGYKVE